MTEQRGFFGFFKGLTQSLFEGSKKADSGSLSEAEAGLPVVSMIDEPTIPRPEPEPDQPPIFSDEVAEYARQSLQDILDLGFGGKVVVAQKSGDRLGLDIVDATDLGRLIGKDGMTLDALQTLVRAFIYKKFGISLRISVDSGDYKRRRDDQLYTQAMKAVNTVLTKGTRASLRPMNASERRYIHTLFQDDARVKTFSVGDGNYRHIVIEKKFKG